MVNPRPEVPVHLRVADTAHRAGAGEASPLAVRWLAAARWAWGIAVLAALTMFVASVPMRNEQLVTLTFPTYSQADIYRAGDSAAIRLALTQLGLSPSFYAGYSIVLEVVFALVFCIISLTIVRQKSHPWLSMLISFTLATFGLSAVPTIYALASANAEFQFPVRFLNTLCWTLFGLFYYLFPDGRFVPRRIWPLAALWVTWQMSWGIFPDVPWNPLSWPADVALAVWRGWFIIGIAAQAYRYIRVSTPAQQQQTKWVVFGLAITIAGQTLISAAGTMPILLPGSALAAIYELAKTPLTYLFALLIPISMAISILRYRLWEIDLLINRTLVYIPLTALVAGLYSTSITLSQRLFVILTGEKSDTAIVMTTLVVASTFTPIKNSLQAFVDRRFKEAPDPTKRLAIFGAQMNSVVQIIDMQNDIRHVTRRALDEVVAAFDARCGAVHLYTGGGEALVQIHGPWEECGGVVSVPIESDGKLLGRLSLGPRHGGAEYTERDLEALEAALVPVGRAIQLARRAA